MPGHAPPVSGLRVIGRGEVGESELSCAAGVIAAVLRHHGIASNDARVRVTSPTASGASVTQVNLRVGVTMARVQAAGAATGDAIGAAASRLDRQVRRLLHRWEPWSWPDPHRPFLGGPGPSTIGRTKQVRLRRGLPCQAAADMNTLDFDVHLFVDADTGEDAIVYRTAAFGTRLARQHHMHPPSTTAGPPMTVNPRRVHMLTPVQAARQLSDGWLAFLFFTDASSGRGNLMYRRYAGDIALVCPESDGDPSQ